MSTAFGPSMVTVPGTLPPSTAYYTYGAADAPAGNKAPMASYDLPGLKFDDDFLEAQGESVELSKPVKKSAIKGFGGYSLADLLSLAFVFLVPLLIFAAVYALISYYWHFKYTVADYLLLIIIFAFVVYLGYVASKRMFQSADGSTDHLAVWAAAGFIGVLLAFFLAMIFGWRNYGHYMQPTYQWQDLNTYKDVNPSTMSGKAFMDAGTITFSAGSHLDLSKSAGFMNLDMYCIAPIVTAGKTPANATYDFWAIGVNCCTGASQNFACGKAVQSKDASAGLRLMSEGQLPFYQMAVTQATTKYGIKTGHPIFVYWVQDASKAISDYQTRGWNDFLVAILSFAIFMALIAVASAFGVMIVKSKYA